MKNNTDTRHAYWCGFKEPSRGGDREVGLFEGVLGKVELRGLLFRKAAGITLAP